MANLDKSNISTGQTVAAAHVAVLYDALIGTTIYDNVKTLLGNIKEYTVVTLKAEGDWNQTILSNTTGGTCVINQGADYYFSITFTDFTLPVIEKIFMTSEVGKFISEGGEVIHFVYTRYNDSTLNIYHFDSQGAGIVNLPAGVSFSLRLLFYP